MQSTAEVLNLPSTEQTPTQDRDLPRAEGSLKLYAHTGVLQQEGLAPSHRGTPGLQRASLVTVLGTSRFCLAATRVLYQLAFPEPPLDPRTHGALADSLGGELSRCGDPAGLSGAAHITPPWQAFPTPQPEFTCPVHRGAASHLCLGLHASHERTASPALKGACRVGAAHTGRSLPTSAGHTPSTQPKPLAEPDSPVSVPTKDHRF